MEPGTYTWSFSTVGGVKRVNLESGSDLVHLQYLDPKLWTALSCPVDGLEIDKKTLSLIDTDHDGQIRVPEIIEAVNWAVSVIKNPDALLNPGSAFPLSEINDSTEQGKKLLGSARVILKNLGRKDTSIITVEDTADTEKIFAGTGLNGDGIITEDTTDDASLVQLINEIVQCTGSVTDRGGKQGISPEILQLFFEHCEKFAAWHAKKEAERDAILPLGENTEAAYTNYCLVKSKIDDFFIRCRLAAFDPQSTETLNLQNARVETITAKDLSGCMDEIATYPIARIETARSLPLTAGINPAWENAIAAFYQLTASHLFPGKEYLSEAQWNRLPQTFAAFANWMSEKDGAAVELLGLERVQEILSSPYQSQLASLIEQDTALEDEANNIMLVGQMARYHRSLFMLLKNFVTFFDFYNPGTKAIFQAGTLYIDQRSCDLCIRVGDMGKFNSLASFSGMYLLYCNCVSRATNEKMTIIAGLTNGAVDGLMVGRNAIFYDRKGLDWDATIIKITDNPISIRQAFFSPYSKLMRMIEEQINKAAAAQDEKNAAKTGKNIEAIPGKLQEGPKPKKDPPPPFDVGKFAGIFAAIGLAIGSIGTIIAAVLGGFMKLVWWKMPFAIAGLLLLISGPAMIIAFIKLRKRNLAPLLEANGWAINAHVKINIQFGRTLTQLAVLPKGAKINFNDPFTKKRKPMLPVVFVLSVIMGAALYLLWKYGFIHIHF